MKLQRGITIDIEGTDGSGKRTTARVLKDLLIAAGFDVEIISFPQHAEDSGMLVDKFLYNGLELAGGPLNKALREGMLYAVDRMVTMTKINENGKCKIDEINEGKIVIFDRYVASNFIHRTRTMEIEDLKLYTELMENLEFGMMRIPQPDYTFVLKVDPVIAHSNILNRGREMDENETLENLTIAHDRLSTLCEIKNYTQIECCEDKEDGRSMRPTIKIVQDIMQSIIDVENSHANILKGLMENNTSEDK